MSWQKVVTLLKNGVQAFPEYLEKLDSGFRRNDGEGLFASASNSHL